MDAYSRGKRTRICTHSRTIVLASERTCVHLYFRTVVRPCVSACVTAHILAYARVCMYASKVGNVWGGSTAAGCPQRVEDGGRSRAARSPERGLSKMFTPTSAPKAGCWTKASATGGNCRERKSMLRFPCRPMARRFPEFQAPSAHFGAKLPS